LPEVLAQLGCPAVARKLIAIAMNPVSIATGDEPKPSDTSRNGGPRTKIPVNFHLPSVAPGSRLPALTTAGAIARLRQAGFVFDRQAKVATKSGTIQ
jgi:hypothetical protein